MPKTRKDGENGFPHPLTGGETHFSYNSGILIYLIICKVPGISALLKQIMRNRDIISSVEEGDKIHIRHRGLEATVRVADVLESHGRRVVSVIHPNAGRLTFILGSRLVAIAEDTGVVGPALGEMEVIG